MFPRMARFVAVIFIVTLVAYVFYTQDLHRLAQTRRLERQLALAEEDNARLRALVSAQQKERALEQSRAVRTEIERQVEEIRGLKFKRPVDYAIVTRQGIQGVLSNKLAENYSEADFTEIARAYSRLGLLPEGYPLRQSYVDLLSEQVAAFFDQHTHKLFMFEDASLENHQNRIILAHELTHALQDQHFELLKLPLEIKDNDDRALAASALVEGEATAVMTAYMLKNLSLQSIKESAAGLLGQNTAQLQKAPRFLRELLIFPYLRGQEFCAAVMAEDGYEALTRCYRRLPSSTAQILHPEKYAGAAPEEPLSIGFPETAFEAEPPAVNNVLGEIGTRLQLATGVDDAFAESAATGWRGDRYLSFARHDTLVWKTAWSDPREAAEFAAAQRQVLAKRYAPPQPREDGVTYSFDTPRAIRLVQAADGTVLLIDAPSPTTADAMMKQFGTR